jgi:hypothetical protein
MKVCKIEREESILSEMRMAYDQEPDELGQRSHYYPDQTLIL